MFAKRILGVLKKNQRSPGFNLQKFKSYSNSLGATSQGTKEFFQKGRFHLYPNDQNKLGWSLSPIGIASYNYHEFKDSEMRKLLNLAFSYGLNVIETSPAYLNGQYETFIGDIVNENKIEREQIVIVSKIGFITEDMKNEFYTSGVDIGPIMASITNEIHYSLNPKYISAQIEKTLSNLKLETIDIVLIQTPELLFPNITDEHSLTHFYNIIANAFICLEEHVKSGKIQAYGIDSKVLSSTTDPLKFDENQYLSLPHLINLANTVTNNDHHFNCISYPLNIFDSRSLSIQKIGSVEKMIQFSYQVTNCKIDTSDISHITGNEWIEYDLFDEDLNRKSKFSDEELITHMKNAVEPCILLEKSYEMMYKAILEKDPQNQDLPHPSLFSYGQYIITNVSRIDYHDYKTLLFPTIKLSIENELKKLSNQNEELKEWAVKYRSTFRFLHEKFLAILEENRRKDMKELSDALEECCEELKENLDLASKCIRIVISTDTSTALIDYRKQSQLLQTFTGPKHSFTPLDKEKVQDLFEIGKKHSQKIKEAIKYQHNIEVEAMKRR